MKEKKQENITTCTFVRDVFEKFRNMYLEIYEFDHAKFLSALGLAWQAAYKMTKVKLDLLTDINIFLMVEKGIRGGQCCKNFH